MKRVKEYNIYLDICGYRDVKIKDVNYIFNTIKNEYEKLVIQLFDADYIAGYEHLFHAILNALKTFNQKRNISDSLEFEILLYASGQRQISKALTMLGIKPVSSNIAALILSQKKERIKTVQETISKLIRGVRDDDVLEIKDGKKMSNLMKTFGITEEVFETEIDKKHTLKYLIVEIGALLAVKS
jgi:KEOPS complex subunit Cgi121